VTAAHARLQDVNLRVPIDAITGLSEDEAARRLAREGHNELPSTRPRGLLAIALSVVREPIFLLLIACGVVYLLLGDAHEALMLLGFVFVVMGLTLFQERKAERALEALRDLSSPRALVIRGAEQKRIPGREVVCGDIMVLSEGDRVPADAVVVSCINLAVDESLLSGESAAVGKAPAPSEVMKISRPGGEDSPSVFSGTLVVQGKGVARVVATGGRTEIGRIGKALTALEAEPTHIQRDTAMMVKRIAWVGLALAVIVAVTYGATRGDWLNGLLVGITLAMAILPEELPVVLTVFLALGAWRISKREVLTRRVPAVEMLGATTVLCVDKTGTLTENRMTLASLCVGDAVYELYGRGAELPETFHELLEFSVLASHRDPFDPMEKAIRSAGLELLAATEHLHADWALVEEYPLSPGLLAMSRVWRSPDSQQYVIAAKGAPEAIVDLCHFNAGEADVVSRHVDRLARGGLRVLGIAKAGFRQTQLPAIQHDFEFEFLGLVGLVDPVRPAVPGAIREALEAGIRVVMITGDHPETALNIARQIGLPSGGAMITGTELDILDDQQLRQRLQHVNVFCRVVPEQKLRLVIALKANGEVVAMTGDGVNDAPALKAAHIGIAMGGRGTDVAREAAALVLLDDDFSSIVEAIKLGRRIFDNLRKAVAFLVSVHVPIVGLSIVPVLLGWPLILMPIHILFLQLIIDPACSLVFEAEPEETDIMRRAPRAAEVSLFDPALLLGSAAQGLALLAILLGIFAIALHSAHGAEHARAQVFTSLIIASLGLILANRSWSGSVLGGLRTPNVALWWVISGALVFLMLALNVPILRDAFRFAPLHSDDLVISMSVGLISFVVFRIINSLKTDARKINVT
jgi:Ca2+-transporting ATPase